VTVFVYSGPDASPTNTNILYNVFTEALHPFGIKVKILSPGAINNPYNNWADEGTALVVGGGQFTQMRELLTDDGVQAIKNFAARKTYLGICKGAYAGAAQLDFLGNNNERKSNIGFGFFNGIAKGSLPITPNFFSGNNDSACVALLHHEKLNCDFPALYWGGPSFILPDNPGHEYEPIVTLKMPGSDQKMTMGVRMNFDGGGKAILVGYHSEAIRDWLHKWVMSFSGGADHDTRLKEEISRHTPGEFYFGFAALLDEMELVPGHSFVDQIMNPSAYDPRTFRKRTVESPAFALELL